MAQPARHPAFRVIAGDGELIEDPDLVTENRALRSALTRLQNAYNALVADKAAERKAYAARADVEDIFEDWKRKMVAAGFRSKARCKLSDNRFDAIKAMLEAGYTLEHFLLANSGVAAMPYVLYGKRVPAGAEKDLQLEIAYICKEAHRFEEAANIGHRAEKAKRGADEAPRRVA
jgi:hypothetical protein